MGMLSDAEQLSLTRGKDLGFERPSCSRQMGSDNSCVSPLNWSQQDPRYLSGQTQI